jgi:hypothetical protein
MKPVAIRKILASAVFVGLLCIPTAARAVTSVITRHAQSEDFLKGKLENLMVDSDGTLRTARRADVLIRQEALVSVWTINTLLAEPDGSAIYLGTSPNGTLFKYNHSQLEILYPAEAAVSQPDTDPNKAAAAPFRNEHVFALAFDAGGRLLAGISGKTARLIRFEKEPKILFQSQADRYIYAIALDSEGTLYLATGPRGRIYRLPPFGGDAEIVYESRDKNILCLSFAPDGSLLAGTDTRGLVYRIDVKTKTARVLYDSQQMEITALATDPKGNIYLAASSVAALTGQIDSASQALSRAPGRPDSKATPEGASGGLSLTTANTAEEEKPSPPPAPPAPPMPAGPKSVSGIYRITPDGFVTELFSDKVLFCDLLWQEEKLLAATGNQGRLFGIVPDSDRRSIVYQNDQSAQITALWPCGSQLMMALSNPPQVVSLSAEPALQGTYTSDLIDAGQPARWGKLQIDAHIPDGASIRFTARSGNLEDPNDPTFSPWQSEKELTMPQDLDCPVARYLQYRLIFDRSQSADGAVLREAAVACSIPNIPPRVQSVQVQQNKDKQKSSLFQIGSRAADENNDTLVFHFDFRRQDRQSWIQLEKDSEKPMIEWDTRTVEDGRYEIRVTADDKRSNSPHEALTGSRVSDIIIVDNTPPVVEDVLLEVQGTSLKLRFSAVDVYSAVGQVRFTFNSKEDWIGLLPEDLVFDTTEEWFTLKMDNMEAGDYVLALAVSDAPGNTCYQTFDVTIPGK